MLRSYWPVVALLALVGSLLAACSGDNGGQSVGTPTPVQSSGAGTATGDVITGQAPVDSVEVVMLESFPVQVQLNVKGNLPDSCTTLDQVNQSRDGNTFNVTIITKRPAGAMCATVVTPYEKNIPLDVAGLKAGTYTVNVNNATQTFELKQDNISP